MRKFALIVGEEVGYAYKTNAPKKRLEELEDVSVEKVCEHCYDEIPVWEEVLNDEGYYVEEIDYDYFNSDIKEIKQWFKDKYNITETYVIDYR